MYKVMEQNLKDKTHWMVKEKTLVDYLDVCQEAVLDEEVFKNFKSDPKYTTILEHCSKKIGFSYYQKIKKKNPWLLDVKSLFDNDLIGSPDKQTIGAFHCSPSTLQYIGVLSNLIDRFESLHLMNIVEIGGGYGGQCKIIKDVFHINQYSIVDLLEPSLLQLKYTKHFNCDKVMTYTDIEYLSQSKIDLVISNYALTEIVEPLQSQYIEKILLNSKHGYITCNGRLNKMHLLNQKFTSTIQIEKDIEGERETNYIITW